MQIVEQTSMVLKLQAEKHFPRFSTVLIGTLFILFGLVIIFCLGQLALLKCNRLEPTQVACELISSDLVGGKHVTSIPTGQFLGAEVEVNKDSDGDTYRVALLTKNGKIPLTEAYTSGAGGKHEKANQINAFVENPQQISLRIEQDDRWFTCLFGGIFTFVGGGLIFASLKVTEKRY